MWIICENGNGVNLNQMAALALALSEHIEEGLPRLHAVVGRFGERANLAVICTRDTEAECREAIKDITDETCGWIDPSQRK